MSNEGDGLMLDNELGSVLSRPSVGSSGTLNRI